MDRIEEIEKKIGELSKEIQSLDNNTSDSFEEYEAVRKPFYDKINKLDRERRMTMIPELIREIPYHSDVMSLNHFMSNVKHGMFINGDGHGRYAKDNKISNIEIYPSDIFHNSIRKDFDTIVWFNK